jgi:hypothetical protein
MADDVAERARGGTDGLNKSLIGQWCIAESLKPCAHGDVGYGLYNKVG